MNNSILKKCLDELTTPTPRIDYVCGMLETLIAMNEANVVSPLIKPIIPNTQISPTAPFVLNFPMETGVPIPSNVNQIKKIAEASTETT